MYIILTTISGFPSVSKIVGSTTIDANNYYWKSYTSMCKVFVGEKINPSLE